MADVDDGNNDVRQTFSRPSTMSIMPAITFQTPPGRPSVLRAAASREGQSNDTAFTATAEVKSSSTLAQPPVQAQEQVVEPLPLTFEKRTLPQLTTSPEPVKESFDLPRPRISLDEVPTQRPSIGDTNRPSLLSTAMVGSGGQQPRSASTTNLGILRRAELEKTHSDSDGISQVTSVAAADVAPSAPRPRLQFLEPRKEAISNVATRADTGASIAESNAGTSAMATTSAATTAAAEHSTLLGDAPRKRSLVIQEHADVLERAAERAARQATLSTEALEQHSRTGAFGRSRQHSTSSAGEETASIRSSWAVRSSSRGSSIGTSPTVVSEDNEEVPTEFDLTKPSEQKALASIFNNTSANEGGDAQQQPGPSSSRRKLVFVDPAPSAKKSTQRKRPMPSIRHDSDHAFTTSTTEVSAVSDSDANAPLQTQGETSRRSLAFAVCPKPEREVRLSPAHATRKQTSKLSASPAPHKLAYRQRLRGIRGDDPIRSPAPDKLAPIATEIASWDEPEDPDLSAEGSGYSEDEEDSDTEEDDEDDDEVNESEQSDIQSIVESITQEDDDDGSVEDDDASPSSSMEVEELQSSVMDAEVTAKLQSALSRLAVGDQQSPGASHGLDSAQAGPSNGHAGRRSITPHSEQPGAASVLQRSPPRLGQPSRSTQTSPRSGQTVRPDRKLKPKDSFTHPMCFLPDAFEESAPPTPTELDSDGYEPPRSNRFQGWLSEGGSAASSRRASWQQQPSPGVRSERSLAEEGLAVPITLPPFRRTRERTAQGGVTSDGEHSSRSLSGNAAFIRESAGFGRSLNCSEERTGKPSPGASPCPSPQPLGISVPVSGRPSQPVMWRHLSTQHAHVTEKPPTGVSAFRRASHSMEPRKANSAFTSPIGSYSHAVGRAMPSHAAVSGSDRPVRPSAGKQRAVSTSSHIRSRPSVAPSAHDAVVVATSPPRDDALTQLKHALAQSPRGGPGGDEHALSSGTTTPGWISDGQQLPSHTTSRYWSERLSSLAQAMSGELSMVGNAVLGKHQSKAGAAVPGEDGAPQPDLSRSPHSPFMEETTRGDLHRRSHSVPLHLAIPHSGNGETATQSRPLTPLTPASAAPEPNTLRRTSLSIPIKTKPQPIFISTATATNEAWTAERDGETQAPSAKRQPKRRTEDVPRPFQFAKKEVGEDGTTRLVVIHTSKMQGGEEEESVGKGRPSSMQFEWAKAEKQ